MDKLPLSVLLLARDEAARLADLLPRLGFAREVVVVVDAATRDATRDVAARHGARVCERALDGFGAQRAFGLAQTRQPWVLWLDADERVDERAVAAIGAAVRSGAGAGYRIARVTWFLGKRIRFCGWRGEKVLRLFRREAASFDDAPVHEQVRIDGAIQDLDGTIEHRSYETWEDCRVKLTRYAAAGAERMRRAGRGASALDVLVRPPLRFFRMYVLQAGILDGAHGVLVCALAAAQVLLKYAQVWAAPRAHAEAPRSSAAAPRAEADAQRPQADAQRAKVEAQGPPEAWW